MAKLSYETIKKDTRWVAKMNGYREVGTYEEIGYLFEDPDYASECRDFDLFGKQPPHLEEFYRGYWNQKEYYLIEDYYNNVYIKEVS